MHDSVLMTGTIVRSLIPRQECIETAVFQLSYILNALCICMLLKNKILKH